MTVVVSEGPGPPTSEGGVPASASLARLFPGLLQPMGQLWTELCSPQNVCVAALIPSMTVFGDGLSKEVTKVKQGHQGGALIP